MVESPEMPVRDWGFQTRKSPEQQLAFALEKITPARYNVTENVYVLRYRDRIEVHSPSGVQTFDNLTANQSAAQAAMQEQRKDEYGSTGR